MPGSVPLTLEQELALHRRLVDEDPVAPSELAIAYLDCLVAWLRRKNRRQIPQEFIEQAAHEALICLMKKPKRFDASRNKARLPLLAFLRLAAQRDLQNILKQEARHWQGRVSLERVELSPDAGKYLYSLEDPSDRLRLQEEVEKADREHLRFVRQGLSEGERQALEMMLQGERKTGVFARVLGIEHLPKEEKEILVKRVKDKLKKRIQREDHGRTS